MWTSMKGRKFTMKFIPEKAKIVNGIALIVIATMIIMFVILKESENILTKSLMFILIGSVLVVGGFFLAFLKTLYYEIKDETLKIRSIFCFLDIKIPLKEIKYFTEKITLINQTGIAGIISKRFSVGPGYIEGMGKVDMYITNSRKSIFILTERGNYAVSPIDLESFSGELKRHGIKEEYKRSEVLEKDVLESHNKLRQYFLLNSVIILILVVVPMSLFYLNKLPMYISTSQIGSNMLSYVPSKIYMDSMIGYSVMVFILSIIFYALSQIYSKFNKIYFYHLMIIPLVITFLQLLSLANTLIAIFF